MKEKLFVSYSMTSELSSDDIDLLKGSDLTLISGKNYGVINYKRELKGLDDKFNLMGKMSKQIGGVTLFNITTDNYGLIKRSIALYQNGKLISISDSNKQEGSFPPSFGYKIAKVDFGKFGILVNKDICDIDSLKALSLCESEFIVNMSFDIYDFSLSSLVPSLSYLFGLPIIAMGENRIVASGSFGEVIYNSQNKIGLFTLPIKKHIKEIKIKTRGGI